MWLRSFHIYVSVLFAIAACKPSTISLTKMLPEYAALCVKIDIRVYATALPSISTSPAGAQAKRARCTRPKTPPRWKRWWLRLRLTARWPPGTCGARSSPPPLTTAWCKCYLVNVALVGDIPAAGSCGPFRRLRSKMPVSISGFGEKQNFWVSFRKGALCILLCVKS